MSSLLDTLASQLGPDAVRTISRQIGADERTTGNAVQAALPLLLGALARNASSESGAGSLLGALDRDHDGSILDDVLGAFASPSTASVGDGILRHVLGGKRPAAEQGLSAISGLTMEQGSKLLALLAPLILGALGRKARGGGLDPTSLGSMLGSQSAQAEAAMPKEASILTSLLDRDGDGSVLDEVGKMGMGMLGNLFGRKP